jgi:hypothetical protein
MRITVDLAEVNWEGDSFEFRVTEQIRTAKQREICTFQQGGTVHDEDLELLTQVIEDTIRAGVGRTIGLAQRLAF